ncbi:MAG TPA: hypothetical protein VIV60_31260 [Polyangiaceae bacterium]
MSNSKAPLTPARPLPCAQGAALCECPAMHGSNATVVMRNFVAAWSKVMMQIASN